MRSLDECRAEIFARSEKRIEKRRKIRRRMVAGLAPLCLCIALFAILPQTGFFDKYECIPQDAGNGECAGESVKGAMETQRKEARIRSADGGTWILSENETEQLARLLDSYLTDGEQAEDPKEADYEIEISAEDGRTICYLLSGRQLTCDEKNAKLTESQLQQILMILLPELA